MWRWRAWLGAAAILAGVPGLLSAQTTRVAIGVGVEGEHGSSASSLVVSVPIRSIASPNARWGLGPVIGLGTLADSRRKRDLGFGDVGFRVARMFPWKSRPGWLAYDGLALGLAGSAGVGAATPYDTSSVGLPPGIVFRKWTWIPTARLEVIATTRIGRQVTPAVLTYSFGRVFRWSAAGEPLGLGTRWCTTFGIEVSTR